MVQIALGSPRIYAGGGALPGFPVQLGDSGALLAAFLNESRIRGRIQDLQTYRKSGFSATSERVPTLITRFPRISCAAWWPRRASLRLSLTKAAYAVASSAEYWKSEFSADGNSPCPHLPLTRLTITLSHRDPSNHGQLP